ncbi:MAG: hypothetical protein IGS03_07815 [Candidatus Sericytochromatia bacterium]|nr:hypothetical protein [Candidatus Sericytochromatia bacterium]
MCKKTSADPLKSTQGVRRTVHSESLKGYNQSYFAQTQTLTLNAFDELISSAAPDRRLQPGTVIPPGAEDMMICTDGQIMVKVGGVQRSLGRLSLYTFENPEALQPLANAFFAAPSSAGEPQPVSAIELDSSRPCNSL